MQLQERPNVNVRIFVVLGTISLLLFIALAAAAPAKEKEPAGQKVDNGSHWGVVYGSPGVPEALSIPLNKHVRGDDSPLNADPAADPATHPPAPGLPAEGLLHPYESTV